MSTISSCLLAVLLAVMPAEFARFRAEAPLRGRAAKPDVSKGRAHHFRTRIREQALEPPNYNGHYRIGYWGCGSNCIDWTIIDLKSGHVWMSKEPVESHWSVSNPEDKTPDWMEFYKDSSLLYVHSWERRRRDRTVDTRRVYVWRGGAPRLLRTEELNY